MISFLKKEEKKPFTYTTLEMRKSSNKFGWVAIIVLGIIALIIFISAVN